MLNIFQVGAVMKNTNRLYLKQLIIQKKLLYDRTPVSG